MRSVILLLVLLLGAGAAVLGLAFWNNDLPWDSPPGRIARVMTYVTTHVADTSPQSPFPELRPRHFPGTSVDSLFAAVDRAVGTLGWAVIQRDQSAKIVRAVVTTPLLKFQDDIEIAVVGGSSEGAQLRVRSVSRVGQGDLGANTAHILTLYRTLDAERAGSR